MTDNHPSPLLKSWRLWVAVLLAVGGLGVSTVLLLEHHGQATAATVVDSVCGPDDNSGCHVVDRSAWSEIRGIPLAALGALFYASLIVALILARVSKEAQGTGVNLALIMALSGLLVDAALLALQAFVIKAYCSLCLLSYAMTIAIAIVLIPAWRRLASPSRWLAQPAQRLLVAGWLAATATTAVSLGAVEWGLASMVPSSAAATTDRPASELSLGEARAEVEHLRKVLSDPGALETYFAERSLREFQHNPVEDIDLAGVQIAGPPNAPVQVVVYSDFLCPWCSRLASWLGPYLATTHGQVAVAFKNYPLDRTCNPKLSRTVHEGSCQLALGGICAAAQGRFWQYHDKTFSAGLERATRQDAERLAQQIGLNEAAFERCLDAPETRQRLDRDIEEAGRVGVHATPSVFVNGRQLPRAPDLPLAVQLVTGQGATAGRQ